MRSLLFALAVAATMIAVWLLSYPVRAHLHGCEGECEKWMMSLRNGWGIPCCEFKEATALEDVQWETAMIDGEPHYKVFIEDQWVIVADKEVVDPPVNRLGPALVWFYHVDQKPVVRCFLPGAGA